MNVKKFLQEHAESQKAERDRIKPLVARWERTRLLEGLSGNEKVTLAQQLQNQANRLLTEASRTSTSAGNEEWNGIALPLVRKIFVEQVAKRLVHTQAMDKPSGLVFYLDFQHDANKPSTNPFYSAGSSVYGTTENVDAPTGGFYGADKFSYSNNYYSGSAGVSASGSASWDTMLDYNPALSASAVAGEIRYVDVVPSAEWALDYNALASFTFQSASAVNTVFRNYTRKLDNGNIRFVFSGSAIQSGSNVTFAFIETPDYYDRGDYEIGQSGVGAIAELNIKVTQRQIVAQTKKLKTEITPEIIQDLDAYQSLDTQKEVINMLAQYIEQEEDTEILQMLSNAGNGIKRYWSALTGRFVNSKTGAIDTAQPIFTQSPNEWFKTLGTRLEDLSNEIHRRTLRGGANWAVVSPKVATLLTSFNTYKASEEGNTFGMGVEEVGKLNTRIRLYKNPYWKENEILVGFKGSNFLETGAVYATYIPLIMTPPLTDPDTFTVKQGIMTRNAKLVVRSEFYGKILIRDLDSF